MILKEVQNLLGNTRETIFDQKVVYKKKFSANFFLSSA